MESPIINPDERLSIHGAEILSAEIVKQAITDWRILIARELTKKMAQKYDLYISYGQLREFFRGEWCSDLLSWTDVTGPSILETLEQERIQVLSGKRKLVIQRGRE